MLNRDTELLKEAEELENQSKVAIRDKKFGLAIQSLLKAKDNYTKLGLTGQVSIIIREIVRLKNLAQDEGLSLTIPREKSVIPKKGSQFKISLDKLKGTKSEDTSMSEGNGYQILENARALALEDKYEEAIKLYKEAYSIFKHLDHEYECNQILWQLNEIRDYQRWAELRKSKGVQLNLRDIVALASAEKRRQKIQQSLGVNKAPMEMTATKPKKPSEHSKPTRKLFEQMKVIEQREEQLKKQISSTAIERQEQIKNKMKEKQNKLQLLREKKKQEDELFNKGQEILERGNQKIRLKDYDAAKELYSEAIELFTQLGWHDQITILQKELRNISVYKKEEELKLKKTTYSKVKEEQEFQKRVSEALTEKQLNQVIQHKRQQAISPENKNKLDKVELIRAKADKEEHNNNFSRALARYEYILSLYNSIPSDAIDLSEEILKTEQKISELKGKV